MFKRNISGYEPEQQVVYKKFIEEAQKLFEKKAEKVTIFHEVLIDRVVNAYIMTLKMDNGSVSEKKFKIAQDNLQSWLRMVFLELHSSEKELQTRQEFYQKCVDVLNELVLDVNLRRSIFIKLKKIVEERG